MLRASQSGGRLAPRVVTVTPNAALDRTLGVAALRRGERQRLLTEHAQAGGKGVNVARVLARLGVGVRTVVVVGGDTGRAIETDLARSGLDPVIVAAHGESRTCVEIVEAETGRATQLHGDGVRADDAVARTLRSAVDAALDGAEWLAVCGSLARGFAGCLTAELVAIARARGVRVALDTSGAALVAGWRSAPDLLRINRDEAAEVLGIADPASLAMPLPRTPGVARLTVVSDGPAPIAAWTSDERAWRVTPPRVRAVNPIGCGDAMLAGLLASADPASEAALRFATALAAADAESGLAGRPDVERARSLTSSVAVGAEEPVG